jgi:hypothetical protein
MDKLTDEQIDELMLFSGTYTEEASDEVKKEWLDQYRKVEEDSIQMINKYSSVQAWYESGEGRLL